MQDLVSGASCGVFLFGAPVANLLLNLSHFIVSFTEVVWEFFLSAGDCYKVRDEG